MTGATPQIAQQFLVAMQTRDLTLSPGQQLKADGQWHRCDVISKAAGGKRDGTYKLCLDGAAPWGLFRNWCDGKDIECWRGNRNRPLTDTERHELERQLDRQRFEHEKEAAELAKQAEDRAHDIWARAKDAPTTHAYLKRKRVGPHGLRIDEHGRLLVPMYAPDGKLVNLQLIDDDGAKWFLKGGRIKGCFARILGKIGPVVITEGFATGATIKEAIGCFVAVAFSASNLAAVASLARDQLNDTEAAIWKAHRNVASVQGLQHERCPTFVDAELIVAADDDWKTKNNPGLLEAIKAARGARARVAVPRFEDKEREEWATDFNDVAALNGMKAVEEGVANAADPDVVLKNCLLADPYSAHSPTMMRELASLKQANIVRYEEFLAALKKNKVRTGTLDRDVKALINKTTTEHSAPEKSPELYAHWAVDTWAEAVETGELLEAVTKQIGRYVATLEGRAVVPALWVIGSYVHEVATHSPLLLVTSPEADSGKSTLLGIIGFLAKRALLSVSISGPALFRSLTKWQPTFIVDEADTALIRNEDLKEVMNSGWTRGQGVVRCDPETNDPRLYSTFAPKAIGMKGKKLPDTTLTRAIIIEMKRKQPGEVVEDFDHLDNDDFKTLRSKLTRWAKDNADRLRRSKPETPPDFHNRTRMNWWLLFAIAELAGAKAAEQAREAAVAIERAKDKGQQPYAMLLLADLKAIFARQQVDVLSSKDIVDELRDDVDAPWATYTRNDKPITQRHLAGLLRPFGISPDSVYPYNDDPDPVLRRRHFKGYARWQFEEAWARYLRPEVTKQGTAKNAAEPPPHPGNRVNSRSSGTTDVSPSGYKNDVTRIEKDNLPHGRGTLPVTRMREGVLGGKKARFRYNPDKAPRLAKARAAMASNGDRPKHKEPAPKTPRGNNKSSHKRKGESSKTR